MGLRLPRSAVPAIGALRPRADGHSPGEVVRLVGAAVAFQVAIGSVHAWSVFARALAASGGPFALSRPEAALPLSVSMGMLWIGAFLGGRVQDQRGPRVVGLASGVVYSAGVLMASLASGRTDFWLVIVGYGLIGGLGWGMGYVVPIAMLQKWFPDRRGLVTGLAVAGFGFGPVLTAPLAQALIEIWHAEPTRAFLPLGAGYLVMTVLTAGQFRNPPRRSGDESAGVRPAPGGQTPCAQATLQGALRSPQWYLMAAILCVNVTAGIGLVSVTADAAGAIAGYGVEAAAALTGLLGVCNGLGRLAWGWLSEHCGRMNAFLAMLGLQSLCLLTLPHASNPDLFAMLAAIVYLCFGGGFGTMPAAVGDVFGLRHVGSIYGLMNVAISLGGTVGPLWVAGATTGGSYGAAFAGLGVAALAAMALPIAVCALQVRSR